MVSSICDEAPGATHLQSGVLIGLAGAAWVTGLGNFAGWVEAATVPLWEAVLFGLLEGLIALLLIPARWAPSR
jgi:Flp pilus assembly pilin Flp